MDIPRKINLGSGKDFRPDYLNLDISNYWSPDIIVDVSGPFLKDNPTFNTRRFGEIKLEMNSFDEIKCTDVLEHLPDLVATMTNCLKLLRVGGVLNIVVPYDLSHGAWQDPTHIRAFNERSWLYYTDWFWYLDWDTHRFATQKLEYILTPLGEEMHKAGQHVDVILRTPRAVDAMHVTFEKVALSEGELSGLREFNEKRRAPLK
jgi:SAM-dependent methyltransferase